MAGSSVEGLLKGLVSNGCSLQIIGSFDPQQITSALGRQPDVAFKKGDEFTLATGSHYHQSSMWGISSGHQVRSQNVQDHIGFIVDFYRDNRLTILGLKDSIGLEIRLRVFWQFEDEVVSFAVPTLSGISAVDVSIV